MIFLFLFTVFLPIDSWHNELLEEIQVRGVHFTCFPSIRPYEMRDLEILDDTVVSHKIWLSNISAHLSYDTVKVLRLKPAIFYDWSAFTIFMQPVVKFGEDSLPPSKKFNDLFSSDYERAYVNFDHTYCTVFIGREKCALGPSPRYNLLLSGYSAPMDWFHFSLRAKKVKFSYYLSRLDDLYTKPVEYREDTITHYINARRYLSIRRFDYSPTEWLNFGISEGAVFGGEDFTLEIYHFNPITLLGTYQYNLDQDVNLFLSIDGRIFLHNLSFFISILIDDFQLEPDPNNEPNHLGVNIGAEFADPFRLKNTFWIAEYTAVSRYTYCHFIPYQRYHYLDTPIGSPFGPDYDEIYTKFIYHLDYNFDIYSRISYFRKGESHVGSIWPIPEKPRVDRTFFPEDNFLSGVVQKSYTIGFGFRFFHRSWFASDVSIGYSHIDNFSHSSGVSKNSLILRFQVDLLNL